MRISAHISLFVILVFGVNMGLNLAFIDISCETLDKLLALSMPQFVHLQKRRT